MRLFCGTLKGSVKAMGPGDRTVFGRQGYGSINA
jgi:hypothetical protein